MATASKTERSVLNEIRKMSSELKDIEVQLTEQKAKVAKLQKSITVVQAEIRLKEASLNTQKKYLQKRLKALQRYNLEQDAMLVLLSREDVTESFRVVRYIRDIAAYDKKTIDNYNAAVKTLSEKHSHLNTNLDELKKEEAHLAKLNSDLAEKKKEHESLLSSVRKEKSVYQKMISDLNDSSKRMLRIIREAERLEKEQKRRELSRGKQKQNAKDDDSSSNFSKLKGHLSWPVSGHVAIRYGSQLDPVFNLPVFRSGVHIKASQSAPVKAVNEGKVVFADEFKGYGQMVILSHGDGYHTLYGNLSRIFAKNGSIIKEGQSIGEVGDSDALGSHGIYFEIRYRGKPLDPQQWLKK
ncbi:MAG: peptidoglycan DD-metalloendopeptidase family protein [Dissulfurispiraceae bacterium]|nr:peptidoglycan DD-metalloendopeptidase family protein [Dissulfurispiraceae bacterium]